MAEALVSPSLAELAEEVRRLRAEVAAVRTARLTLRPRRDRPYLGQPTAVTATLTAGGRPQADVPVTFVATWGRLTTSGTPRVAEGNAVTVRTGADGSARVTLSPPTSEALTAEQQDALEE